MGFLMKDLSCGSYICTFPGAVSCFQCHLSKSQISAHNILLKINGKGISKQKDNLREFEESLVASVPHCFTGDSLHQSSESKESMRLNQDRIDSFVLFPSMEVAS